MTGALSAMKAMAGSKRDTELKQGIFIIFITSKNIILGTDANPPLEDGPCTIDELHRDAS